MGEPSGLPLKLTISMYTIKYWVISHSHKNVHKHHFVQPPLSEQYDNRFENIKKTKTNFPNIYGP